MNELKVKLRDKSTTIDLMDEFDGIGEKNQIIYNRLIIYNQNLLCHIGENKIFNYALIIERGSNKNVVGHITMTNLKDTYLRPNVSIGKCEGVKLVTLKEHIENEVTEYVYNKYVDTNKPYMFSKLYELKAQNSKNRSGYGNIYNGEYLVHEGTKYGETTSYIIVGIYIFKSDGCWGIYNKQWGDIKTHC